MKTISVERLVGGLLVGLTSISFAIIYMRSGGRFPGIERRLAFSVAGAGVIAFSLVGIIAWFFAATNFVKMLGAKNKGASLQDAGTFSSFYVFSNAYLDETGRVARTNLGKWMIVFAGSVIAVCLIVLIARLAAASM